MYNKLSDFLIELSWNPQLKRAYAANAERTMRERGLSDREMDAIRSGDEAAVYRAAGAEDHTVAKLIFGPVPTPDDVVKEAA